MAAFVGGSRVGGVVDGDCVALGELGSTCQEGVGGREDATVVTDGAALPSLALRLGRRGAKRR